MIGFSAPWLLWGLALAGVPVLLHLFARREPPTVSFPAVRYLADTARLHQRRLTVQHLLLLILRTLLIVLLVLAAAGPTWPGANSGAHVPSALVLVLDNSLSSGVTESGVPLIERLRDAARAVLDRASEADALWLLSADGVVRRGTPTELRQAVDSLAPQPRRLDLGEAITGARAVLAGDARPGEVVLITDLQATALGSAEGEGPLTLAWPAQDAVPNAGIAGVALGPQPWTGSRQRITIDLAGNATAPVPFTASGAGLTERQGIAVPGAAVALTMPVARPGWATLTIDLAPDELRLDDRWVGSVRVAPPAGVTWSPEDPFLAAAAAVLLEGGRIRSGDDVTLGALGRGPSIVVPPADPALIGALNRRLAARGVPWRYGERLATTRVTDSSTVLRPTRLRAMQTLEPLGSGATGVLIGVDGRPWLVRAGRVLLLASRMDTAWTELPVTAAFVPFVDALVNRLTHGELVTATAWPDAPFSLPDGAEAVLLDGQRWSVEGGALLRPSLLGVHYLVAGPDTLGTVSVNPDPRESDLRRASARRARDLWPGARVVELERAAEAAFQTGARADLRPVLLWLLLGLALAEAALAGWRRSSR